MIEGQRWFSKISIRVHGYARSAELRRQTQIHMANLELEIEASDRRSSRGALASEVV